MKIVVFDIGGTAIKWGLMEDGRLESKAEFPSRAKEGGEIILQNLLSQLRQVESFDGIAISTAGQVNPRTGEIIYANENIPHYTGMKLAQILRETFSVPVFVDNDVNCAARGEAYFGAGKGFQNFLCLTYGTGVGGAIFLDGKIFYGSSFSAGEFGALPLECSKCEQGQAFSGCYEKFASTKALVHACQSVDPDLRSGRELLQRREEKQFEEKLEEWMHHVLFGMAGLIHLFNPELLIFGGGVMENTWIQEQLQKRLPAYVMPSFSKVKLVPACLGNRAGLYGAYAGFCEQEGLVV